MDTSKKLTYGISTIRHTQDLTSLKAAWTGECEDRVFLLTEIERLRAAQASQYESLSQQVLNAQKFQMDVAQIVNDFKRNKQLYEPHESWPKDDTRTSIIEITKAFLKCVSELDLAADGSEGLSPGDCGCISDEMCGVFKS